MANIEIGSVVQLKSGGPTMTVESFGRRLIDTQEMNLIYEDDLERVNCQWFEGSKLLSNIFPVSSLQVITDGGDKSRPLGIYVG